MPPGDAFLLFRKLVPKPFHREKCLPMDGTTHRSEVNLESHPSQTNQTWCHQLRASLSALLGLRPSTAPRQRLCTFLKNSFQLKCDFTQRWSRHTTGRRCSAEQRTVERGCYRREHVCSDTRNRCQTKVEGGGKRNFRREMSESGGSLLRT